MNQFKRSTCLGLILALAITICSTGKAAAADGAAKPSPYAECERFRNEQGSAFDQCLKKVEAEQAKENYRGAYYVMMANSGAIFVIAIVAIATAPSAASVLAKGLNGTVVIPTKVLKQMSSGSFEEVPDAMNDTDGSAAKRLGTPDEPVINTNKAEPAKRV